MRRQPKARTTKSKSRIDDFTEIKHRAHQRRKDHVVELELNMERLGNKIAELHKISKSYKDKVILDQFSYSFQKGERVGIIGKNGTGKSTFLNLFDRKKQYDFVEKLSGGERKRLYLCTVLIQNPNFLILDEPTNDLDIVTLNVLESFLLDFPGCLIVVSHDRYFMDKIVDHLFIFRGNGIIEDFPGNYSDFRVYDDSKPIEKEKTEDKKEKKNWKKDSNVKLSYNEQKEYKNLESKIKSLEFDKAEIEKQFLNPELSTEEITELSNKIQTIIEAIEEKEMRWFELTEKMEG